MPLRHKLLAVPFAALMLAPLPAAARDEAPADIAGRLSDPGAQVAVAVALTAISEALLDMRIEPLRRALEAVGDEGMTDLPPDARLRDLAGPGARELPGEIGRRVPQAMGAAAGMAGAFEGMLPEIEAMAERMRNAIPRP